MSAPTPPGLLVPVWKDYQWIAPVTQEALDRFWPSHPVAYYVGIPADETPSGGESIPVAATVDRSNWTAVLREGVREMDRRGFTYLYLILEEHIPVASCHEAHLNITLPFLMQSLPAVYISLMGWDNRRYTSRSPVLDAARYRLKHLNRPGDPRFHLHPALWNVRALLGCCDLALGDPSQKGSAWHFEKINDRDTRHHPPEWRTGCYQIHSASMRLHPPNMVFRCLESLEYHLYQLLQGIYPLIPSESLRKAFVSFFKFDDVFCHGPYPLFFSGIMSKGGVNPFFKEFLKERDPDFLSKILVRLPGKS